MKNILDRIMDIRSSKITLKLIAVLLIFLGIANQLIEKETLYESDLDSIINGETIKC